MILFIIAICLVLYILLGMLSIMLAEWVDEKDESLCAYDRSMSNAIYPVLMVFWPIFLLCVFILKGLKKAYSLLESVPCPRTTPQKPK